MMIAFIAAAAAAVVAAPLPPAGQVPRALTIDGVEISYVRRVAADGKVVLEGEYRLERERTPFRYRVRGDRVRGEIGGERYMFPLPGAG